MVIYKHYWVVNVALTVGLGVVSARTVAGAIERGLQVPPGPVSPTAAGAAAPVETTPRQVRSGVIVERNLFNSKNPGGVTEPPGGPRGAAAPAAPPPLAPLNARLIGTVVGDGTSFAIIEDGATRRQELYRLNESVLDAKLIEIERDRVALRRGGKTEYLEMALLDRPAGPALPPIAAPRTPAPQTSSGIAQGGENSFVVDQRELEHAFENMNQLLTQARMVPFFNAGKAEGFRIFAIRPNSLFEKIGLRDGDVLQRINGNELTDPARAFELFEQLKDERVVQVDLVRNGAKQTLSYEIR